MKRAILTVTAIFMTLSAMAFETKVQTKSVGEVTISSKDKMWSIDAKLEQKGELECITIELQAPQAMTPPKFDVVFSTPQLDAHHLWDSNRYSRMILRSRSFT